MVANGELEVFTVERHTNDPMRAESGSKHKVNAYRRAWKNPNDSNRLGLVSINKQGYLIMKNLNKQGDGDALLQPQH